MLNSIFAIVALVLTICSLYKVWDDPTPQNKKKACLYTASMTIGFILSGTINTTIGIIGYIFTYLILKDIKITKKGVFITQKDGRISINPFYL